MVQKPNHLSQSYAEVFQDTGVVDAYIHRPPYPAEVFNILAGLVKDELHVLDVGCGTGNLARRLIERVERIDAVDFSQHMIEQGKRLPNGRHPGLRWLYGRVEDVALDPPYGLVTAGESLHWMDWNIVLPRFYEVLVPGGFLAIIEHDTRPFAWHESLHAIIPRYSTNKDFAYFNMIEYLEQHHLFRKVGEHETPPVPFTQSIDEYIESYHSRNGFSRERMGAEQAAAFDREAREILLKEHGPGPLSLEVIAQITWGYPLFR